MADEVKRWQTRVWTEENGEPAVVYAQSLAELPAAAASYLKEHQPLCFSNMHPKSDSGRRATYCYYDGSLDVPGYVNAEALDEEGWYYISAYAYSRPQKLKSFEDAVAHFVRYAIVTEKGPDYAEFVQENPESNLLYKIKTIRRESNEIRVNDLLQRGWVIIAMEYEFQGKFPEESQRRTIFVLGHPEEGAI